MTPLPPKKLQSGSSISIARGLEAMDQYSDSTSTRTVLCIIVVNSKAIE